MLEAKYYRDYRHNYMILRCRQKENSGSYQHKILTSGKIGEILKCSVRHINGTTYYYYDISSRTTLEGLYRGKQMSYDQVRDVLYQLYGICEKLAGYFMEEAGLVLQPEHIYYDITNNKYIGLYYPDYGMEGVDAYRPLMDFLLEHIDTNDVQLTEAVYRLCEMVEEEQFCIEDALRILESRGDSVCETAQELERIPVWEEPQGQITNKQEMYNEIGEIQTEESRGESTRKKSLFYPVFMVLSIIGMAGTAVVYNIYDLTQEEQLMIFGLAAVMGVCLLICIVGMTGNKKKHDGQIESRQGTDRDAAGESKGKTDRENFADENIIPLEHVISRDMNLELTENQPSAYHSEHRESEKPYRMNSNSMQEDVNYGNTVFFDERRAEEYKLYAVDKKNKRHIELKQFPCTVGKMAGCVDYVLADDSVSRIHARFDKQGDKVLMTDMNSTNGTYKNGLRMQPQETVEIEPGDEIRFGSLNYCYR